MTVTLTPNRARQIVAGWLQDPIDIWRQQLQAQRWSWRALTHQIGQDVESGIAQCLTAQGHHVELTRHKAPYDLLVNGTIRVEIKAAGWHARSSDPRYGRYQAHIRQSEFDVLVLVCQAEQDHCFVIPRSEVRSRQIEITQQDPTKYRGRLARYRNAWGVL